MYVLPCMPCSHDGWSFDPPKQTHIVEVPDVKGGCGAGGLERFHSDVFGCNAARNRLCFDLGSIYHSICSDRLITLDKGNDSVSDDNVVFVSKQC